MTAAFDCWATYYDLIHEGLPGELPFYVEEARKIGGPVLEIGCGTGRITIPLAQAGLKVTGLDNSPAMLARCREKMKEQRISKGAIYLIEADMMHLALEKQFRCVVMPYRTFMHALTPAEQMACLQGVWRHLEEDGVFIMNTWAAKPSIIMRASALSDIPRLIEQYAVPGTTRKLLHYYAARYDEFQQLLIETNEFQEVNQFGAIVKKHSAPLIRAWTTPRELNALTQGCGFTVVEIYGDFGREPFGPTSTELILVLRKKK